MTEEQVEKENREEEEGDVSPKGAVESAREVLEQFKEQNKLMTQSLARLEELKATEMLSGTANAGQPSEDKKEESAKDYAKRVMEGKL